MIRINGYQVSPATSDNVGDWQGEEERAAAQFTSLCEAVAARMPHNRWLPDDSTDGADQQPRYERLCESLWDAYGSEPELLTWTAAQIQTIARRAVDGRTALTDLEG